MSKRTAVVGTTIKTRCCGASYGIKTRSELDIYCANLYEVTVDLPPAQDELCLFVSDLLQTLQLFEGARVENVKDFLPGALQHRRVELRLPAVLHYVLFTIWRLRGKR